ncbi:MULTISPECIES: esterase [unclassified Serratia (in: enterobacteria)]|uniref:esterase n=1 Tax=unclassified Serratia (in: enterobacteria) TaxID=2647522 RepID=UPI0005017B94|nr:MULTISPECIES: esterase [unclassified Serratia (in: enterobacteria)]KFK91852.1 esterase [Serratia sp. Ag2]KFK95486.1 esterase [Serratia sp. Ag1]
MVEMHDERAGNIAVIHAVPAGQYEKPLPTVFFYHGYTSSKEVYAYFAYALAKAGFRVVMPDCERHGERFDGNETLRLAHFWEILKSNVDELPALKAHFEQRGLIAGQRVGVGGASMGGMTTLAAFARYSWVKAAASLMGSGYFTSLAHTLYPPLDEQGQALDDATLAARLAPLADYGVEHHWDCLAGRPLLLWHGEADDVVPAAESERLASELRLRGLSQTLTYLTEAGVRHRITPGALAATVAFFQRAL